jgi:hypothetical protein
MIYTVDKKHRKDYDLLDAYIQHYNVSWDLFNSIQRKKEAVKNYATIVINSRLLIKEEIDLIYSCFTVIDEKEKSVKNSFNLYKLTIIEYEDKKK